MSATVLSRTFPYMSQEIVRSYINVLHKTNFYLPLVRGGNWALAKIDTVEKTITLFDPSIQGVPQKVDHHLLEKVFTFLDGVFQQPQRNLWTMQQSRCSTVTLPVATPSVLHVFCILMHELELWSHDTMLAALKQEMALRNKIREMGFMTLAWLRGCEYKDRKHELI
mmetsp:Transcript_2301/g.3203  ORF Transcript_2301/g.3203 Transcript_2301/m.3203 type:complete len:167 (-) Transcript_2301:98-598(-)